MAVKGGHWYRIRLIGSAQEASLEHARMLKAISKAMAVRTIAAAAKRTAGETVRVRPARIYTDRDAGIVCYLDDGALALYRIAGGLREPEAHLDALPDVDRLTRTLDGRYYAVD